jgi:hypothetical protein
MSQPEIDQILRPIAEELSLPRDALLELREAATQKSQAGRCISCYFKILANSTPEAKTVTTPLRRWLEQHLEVVAHTPDQKVVKRLPVSLSTDDIKDYCHQLINEIHKKQGAPSLLSMQLSFKFIDTAASPETEKQS